MSIDRQVMKDRVWCKVAQTIAELGTCARRKTGAVFLDHKGRVLATGYNGSPAGVEHCIDVNCPGATFPSGSGLELCEAIHAEQNALVQCKFPDSIHTVYCTTSPCMHCVKMLATTSAIRIVFVDEYPHHQARVYWEGLGRRWEKLEGLEKN
jgi:dCMP deaminase